MNPMVGGPSARSSNPRIRAAENLAAFEDDFAPPAKPVGSSQLGFRAVMWAPFAFLYPHLLNIFDVHIPL
jgi:hypothetical protein